MNGLHIELIILFVLIILTRILYLIHKISTGFSRFSKRRTKPCNTVICIGSGGHTTEMLKLLETIDFAKYNPRCYVVANSDKTSVSKILEFENLKTKSVKSTEFKIIEIPRSRYVNQSYYSSLFTTIYSILYSVPIICKIRPELILCNGPGTCIPICLTAFTLKVAFICDTKTVFIESFCRTKTFSLSGKILFYFADNILIQWPKLKRELKRAEYVGQLM